MSQKVVLFAVSVGKTSNATEMKLLEDYCVLECGAL
jgi:hypothetical protein